MATSPAGLDYHAMIVARPSNTLDDYFFFETIDGPIHGPGSIDLHTGPAGTVRIAYHNGLGARGNLVGAGSLSFYREEDEDEISRSSEHATRGALRCFAGDLLVQDDVTDVHGRLAGLDDQIIALNPRPSIDPDPCGRATDPAADYETAYRAALALTAIHPTLTVQRPFSRYQRLPGESDVDLARRTNSYRIQSFRFLRDLLGDLGALDGPFGRSDGRSWNAVDVDAQSFALGGDELLGSGARSGALDTVFLALDELADDLCGDHGSGVTCAGPVTGIGRTRCPAPGQLERNPNPFFRGLFYSETIDPSRFNGGAAGADYQAFLEYQSTFDPTGISDDALGLGLAPLETPGMARDVLRGMILRDGRLGRRGDHICQPIESCSVTSAPRGVRASPPFAPGDTEQVAAGAVDTEVGQGSGVCPAFRSGSRLRYPGRCSNDPTRVCYGAILAVAECPPATPADPPGTCLGLQPILRRITDTQYGCCDGYEPIACATSSDCSPPSRDGLCEATGPLRCSAHPELPCARDDECPDGPELERCQPMRVCRTNLGAAPCATDADCGSDRRCEPWLECEIPSTPLAPCSSDDECAPGYAVRRCRFGACEEWTDPRDRSSEWVPLCRSELCRGCGAQSAQPDRRVPHPPMYCDDGDTSGLTVPDVERELCDTALCRSVVAGGFTTNVRAAMHLTRDAACGPGTRCAGRTEDIDAFPACIARPVLGHYFVRSLGDQLVGSLLRVVESVAQVGESLDLGENRVTFDETLGEVRLRWVENRDSTPGDPTGGLRLPGYLELVIRFVDPAIQAQFAGFEALSTGPARLRIRLQPYFYPSSPPSASGDGTRACDDCGRRRLDQTIHLTPAAIDVLRDDIEGSEEPPAVTGCCGTDACTNCMLQQCAPAGSVDIREVDEVPDLLADNLTGVIDRNLEHLDRLLYLATSDPTLGGLILGRSAAIDELRDAPDCGPGPARYDGTDECMVFSRRPGVTQVADTIELLRITDGRVAVFSRDNRPFLGEDCNHVLDVTNAPQTVDLRRLRPGGGVSCGGSGVEHRDAHFVVRVASDVPAPGGVAVDVSGVPHVVEVSDGCRSAPTPGVVLPPCTSSGGGTATTVVLPAPTAGRYFITVSALGETGALTVRTRNIVVLPGP